MRRSGSGQCLARPVAMTIAKHLRMLRMCFFLMKWNSIYCPFLSAQKKRTKRKHHPSKASPQGEDATAPTRRSFTKVCSDHQRSGIFFYFCAKAQYLIPENTRGAARARSIFDRLLPKGRKKGQTAPTSGDWWESVDIEQKKVWRFGKVVVTLQR